MRLFIKKREKKESIKYDTFILIAHVNQKTCSDKAVVIYRVTFDG